MAQANTTTSMVGNFRTVYGPSIIDKLPGSAKLMREIKFEDSLGDKYKAPVELQHEHGFTYLAPRAGRTQLQAPTAGQSGEAEVDGYQIIGRAEVDYEALAKANSEGTKAFAKATKMIVKRLLKAGGKRAEMSILHGKRGWGTINTGGVSGSSTTRTWVLSEASWIAAAWAGSKDMQLDVYAADYSGTAVNANAAVTITGVDLNTRTLSVSGNATDLTAITAGMHLFPRTASPTSDMPGIDYTIRFQSGTLHNISATNNEMWRGHVVSSVGAPSMSVILDGVRRAAELGLEDDTVAIVPARAFTRLAEDVAALRKYDYSYKAKMGENGVEEITFYGQTGATRIMPHLYQKQGQIHIVSFADWLRVGAQELDFVKRDGTEERIIFDVPDYNTKEMRLYGNWSPFCEAPSNQVVLDGITYS